MPASSSSEAFQPKVSKQMSCDTLARGFSWLQEQQLNQKGFTAAEAIEATWLSMCACMIQCAHTCLGRVHSKNICGSPKVAKRRLSEMKKASPTSAASGYTPDPKALKRSQPSPKQATPVRGSPTKLVWKPKNPPDSETTKASTSPDPASSKPDPAPKNLASYLDRAEEDQCISCNPETL